MPINKIIYPEVKKLLFFQDMTVSELAVRAGIKYTTLNRKLKNKVGLNLNEAIKIRNALAPDVSIEELFHVNEA